MLWRRTKQRGCKQRITRAEQQEDKEEEEEEDKEDAAMVDDDLLGGGDSSSGDNGGGDIALAKIGVPRSSAAVPDGRRAHCPARWVQAVLKNVRFNWRGAEATNWIRAT